MKARFVYESMDDILRPKTGEEIIRDLSKLSKEEKNNQLIKASREGHKDIVKILLKAGADVNSKNRYGDTALIWASARGHKDRVKMLLKAGADVNARDKNGDTALILASINGHKDIVKMLLKAGADVNTKDMNIVELLKKYGANEIS